MKLKEYFPKLEKLIKEHPESLEFEVITSKDDEGNGFNRVFYSPDLGMFEDGEFDNESETLNSICLN